VTGVAGTRFGRSRIRHPLPDLMPPARSRPSSTKIASFVAVVAVTAVLSAVSCSTAVDPDVDPGVAGNGSATELRVHWARWRAAGPRSYSYELRRDCFCGAETVTPARVEVRDGRVVDIRSLATGQRLSFAFVPTIDLLFEWAIAEAEAGGHVEVAYHPLLSYPTRLVIGTLANDAGVAYGVTALVGR
jgi:uncharacterized protein DUF6174